MVRSITWLHTSDFHLRESHAWPQDAVLFALRADIERRRKAGLSIDFILATGDLAFSGKPAEYALAGAFFDELSIVTGVPRERIFSIPGNHDVERGRQAMAFAGARQKLQNESDIYAFLSNGDERETLFKRLESYRAFQESYFAAQARTWTPDGLGYVSALEIDGVRIAIAGLDSARLADGGMGDHGKLLLGEFQVREALQFAQAEAPHIVMAMGHHPLHLLHNFDRGPSQRQIEEVCQFFHCGHLHEPDAHDAIRGASRCLTLSAGASFESRESHNAYSIITLDLLNARRIVTFVQFDPHSGAFSYEYRRDYPLEINATRLCSIGELGAAIEAFAPATACPFYLAALLLEMKAEVPIPTGSSFVFGTIDVLAEQADGEVKRRTLSFLSVANLLRLFSGRMPLSDILARHGEAVRLYADKLESCCKIDTDLRGRLEERERDACALASVEPLRPYEHTLALLERLRADEDWDGLRNHALRLADAANEAVSLKARRMLALCLARSTERTDHKRAAAIYRDIGREGISTAEDLAMLASVLVAMEDYQGAKMAVLSGLAAFPGSSEGFAEIGQRIVEATGDHDFRNQLNAQRAGRKVS